MQHKLAVAGALVVIGLVAAFAIPTYADSEEGSPSASVTVDQTFPRVTGVVTLTNANGSAAAGIAVTLSSTYDAASALPAATMTGFTDGNGVYSFGYQTVSAAHIPGAHTLTVTAVVEGVTVTASTMYVVIA